MRRMLGFLLLFCIWVYSPTVGFSDIVDSDVSADKNTELLESSIKDNELEFDNITEEVKKRYPDFDWSRFQELKPDAKRIVVKTLLAQEAFKKIKENYKTDIYARAKDGIETTDESVGNILYYNKSDKLYITDYVYENIIKEAEKQNLLNKKNGGFYFKQQDVSALDKIIADKIAKAPAEMYCDKMCGGDGVTIPYNKNCEEVFLSCSNVEHIPEQYERFYLIMSKTDDNEEEILYGYDDIEKNEHVDMGAFKNCECGGTIDTDNKSIECECDISFTDFVSDFKENRYYENKNRIDIKNGKFQDKDEKGGYKHDYVVSPAGKVYKKLFSSFGQDDESIYKKHK